MNSFIRDIVPPVFFKMYRALKPRKYGWIGSYLTWEEANKACTGYDSDAIVDKVKAALLKVKSGEAAYERDGVVFQSPNYSWPLLSALLITYIEKQHLNVLDFGGSLGSTYFQHKQLFAKLNNFRWNVIEQLKFVEIGKKEFESDRLKFFCTVDECLTQSTPNVLLLGSVLQYMEKPYELLSNLLSHNYEYVIIDRTPFENTDTHRITVQKVHPGIYEASYPSHLFSETEFLNYLNSSRYQVVSSYSPDKEVIEGLFLQGFILKLKNDK
jgi:putative methyltransferase (TIGR04325 family)